MRFMLLCVCVSNRLGNINIFFVFINMILSINMHSVIIYFITARFESLRKKCTLLQSFNKALQMRCKYLWGL